MLLKSQAQGGSTEDGTASDLEADTDIVDLIGEAYDMERYVVVAEYNLNSIYEIQPLMVSFLKS